MNQTSYPGQFLDACQVPNCHCHYVYCIVNFHLSSTGKLIFGEHVLKHAQQDLFSLSPLIPVLSIWNSHNSLWKVFYKVYHFSLVRKLEKIFHSPSPNVPLPSSVLSICSWNNYIYREKTVKCQKFIYTQKMQVVPQLMQKLAVSAAQAPRFMLKNVCTLSVCVCVCGREGSISVCIHVPLSIS